MALIPALPLRFSNASQLSGCLQAITRSELAEKFALPRRHSGGRAIMRCAVIEKRPGKARERVDRMTLGPAVTVVDPVTLVMAAHQPGRDQFGYGTRQIGLARCANALAQLGVDLLFGLEFVLGKLAFLFQLVTHALSKGKTARITLAHRAETITKPVAKKGVAIVTADDRTGAAVLPGNLGDERKQHEGIARPRADLCEPFEELG